MTLQNGDIVGQYEIVGQLGQGGMANVYRAYHEKLDRHVAIKVMHSSFSQDQNFLERFTREARIVARLEHPNIVPIYDFSEHEGQPYLVMKMVEGRTLKAHIMKYGGDFNTIDQMLSPIANALDYAHKRGILHRDIKPSNIMIDHDGKSYLTDFGLARIAQSGESTISADMMLGTPQYISPEQAKGNAELDSRTDIYSLGIILYELITGFVPYNADTPYATVHDHIYATLPLPSEVNADLPYDFDALLLKALAKDPDKRYATAGEMMQAFGAIIKETSDAVSQPQAGFSQSITPEAIKAPPPVPPVPPQAPKAVRGTGAVNVGKSQPEHSQKRKVEREFDMAEFDFRDFGKKMEYHAKRFASMIEEKVETELDSRFPDDLLSDEVRIRKEVEKRHKEKEELTQNITAYIFVNIGLWAIWLLTGTGFPWPFFPTFFWGMGVFFHWMQYSNNHGKRAQRKKSEIQEEIEAELRRKQRLSGKPKNDDEFYFDESAPREVRLNEDGELTDSFVDEIDRYEQRDGY